MKDLNLLVWLTQLGISVAGPLAGFILLAVWLYQQFNLGVWILILGIFLGISGAIDGFRVSLKAMESMTKNKSNKNTVPPVSFNDHM